MNLFEKREIPDVYQKIAYADNSKTLYEVDAKDLLEEEKHHMYTVALIPEYLNPVLKKEDQYIQKTYYQNNLGYAIRMKDVINIDSYLKSQFKSNHKVVKRSLTRLESCFNINYKVFFGSITKEEYAFLMSALQEMLVRRFAQRNDEHKKLREWNIILDNTFDQINRKEASLFIIYDGKKPIDISLNYHFDKIIFSAISSYDIDYHKFGVGHVEMIKLVEWCLKDQFELLELGYGDLEYKRRWCNYIYQFKYQVVYNEQSLIIPLLAKIELYKLSVKEFLKEKKVNLVYNNLREKFSANSPKRNETAELTIEKRTITEPDNTEYIAKIDPDSEKYKFLRIVIYEFLYSTVEHKDNTSIFMISESPKSFLIRGKNNAQQITYRN
ncbi:GNAT family N-acetyltransferase [Sediminicola sp. 1XM1-17]|uniref:GNAT family N-acetyltransferase n=1 Tax=Sediminicola sp. 1XM1-17 TaxID=3127702 RepID=UPI003077A2A4